MLQGLRRKIGRYAPVGSVEEDEDEREQRQKLKDDATPLEVAIWQFKKHERALRQLETAIIQMLDQIRVDIWCDRCRIIFD